MYIIEHRKSNWVYYYAIQLAYFAIQLRKFVKFLKILIFFFFTRIYLSIPSLFSCCILLFSWVNLKKFKDLYLNLNFLLICLNSATLKACFFIEALKIFKKFKNCTIQHIVFVIQLNEFQFIYILKQFAGVSFYFLIDLLKENEFLFNSFAPNGWSLCRSVISL